MAWWRDATMGTRVALACGVAGAVAMASGSFGLLWDGAYFLFRLLTDGAPFIVYRRYGGLPFQVPTLIAAALGAGPAALTWIFTLSYALTPALALAASLRVLRGRDPALAVWPALGLLVLSLPGQPFLVSESVLATQLAWPILLWLLVGAAPAQLLLVAPLTVVVLLLHPGATATMGAVAACALASGLVRRERRVVTAALVLLGLVAIRYVAFRLRWEGQWVKPDDFPLHYKTAVKGWVFGALGLAWAAGIALLAGRFRAARVAAIALAALAVAALVVWASRPSRWAQALNFRTWAPFLAAPGYLLAALDATFRSRPGRRERGEAGLVPRGAVAAVAGLGFLLVVSMQSWSTHGLLRRVETAVRESPGSCLDLRELKGARGTALWHWAIAPQALLLQGPAPRVLVVDRDPGCRDPALADEVVIAGWDRRSRGRHGWFDLTRTGLPADAPVSATSGEGNPTAADP